jgi:hypothetical protein
MVTSRNPEGGGILENQQGKGKEFFDEAVFGTNNLCGPGGKPLGL